MCICTPIHSCSWLRIHLEYDLVLLLKFDFVISADVLCVIGKCWCRYSFYTCISAFLKLFSRGLSQTDSFPFLSGLYNQYSIDLVITWFLFCWFESLHSYPIWYVCIFPRILHDMYDLFWEIVCSLLWVNLNLHESVEYALSTMNDMFHIYVCMKNLK